MNKIKSFITGLLLCLGLFTFPARSVTKPIPTSKVKALLFNSTLCSTNNNVEAKCTGSAYCRACKNCKYCKYCNSGGSCGVCAKRPKKSYSVPKKKNKETSTKSTSNNTPSLIEKKVTQSKQEPVNTPGLKPIVFKVIQNTSLRLQSSSTSKVLKRLQIGAEVKVIDSAGEYWWKVIYNGEIGWAKRDLLRPKKLL